MLIINADDLGKDKLCTDAILACFKGGRITSASGMMFMTDSERSAELALENGLDIGLHLNFSLRFNGNIKLKKLNEYQQDIATFLLKNKYFVLLYNPLLRRNFDYVFKAQYEEYFHLYKNVPTHIDGHRHLHLCMNVLVDKIIPVGSKVRRNFTFGPKEKDPFNRFYRSLVDKWLKRKYKITDYFLDIVPINHQRLQEIIDFARSSNVELMVHPEREDEYKYITMSDEYLEAISGVETGTYVNL